MLLQRRKQSKPVFRMAAILYSQRVGATWIPQKRWQKSILKFIFLMEPVIRVMARILLIILAESIEARYLSGIVAGMNTKSGKIGYVAAQDSSNSEVTGGIDAFAIGVASVNKSAKIYVKITNSWYDAAKEKAASEKLLSMGCDVMAQHCDTAYPQTLAQEKGVYGIGYNSDMSKETPDSCLTSVIWNWSAYYTSAVQSIMDGTWTGENYYGGMAEGLIQITDLASFAKEGTQEKVDEATTAILSGENNVFDGVLETNTGKKIGAANSTLDDATITGNINWYYKNVVIVK